MIDGELIFMQNKCKWTMACSSFLFPTEYNEFIPWDDTWKGMYHDVDNQNMLYAYKSQRHV